MRDRMSRFAEYMAIKGLNDNKVTLDCGLSVGLLGQARTGKSDLGNKTIEKILMTYQDLSKVWLLTGEGDMLSTSPTQVTQKGNGVAVGVNNGTSTINAPVSHVTSVAHADETKAMLNECKSLLQQITSLVSSASQMMNNTISISGDMKQGHGELANLKTLINQHATDLYKELQEIRAMQERK